MDSAPICPQETAHGVMCELLDSGLYYCYACRWNQWLRESRRILERAKSLAHSGETSNQRMLCPHCDRDEWHLAISLPDGFYTVCVVCGETNFRVGVRL